MIDYLIKQANLFINESDIKREMDVAIKDGKIADVGKQLEYDVENPQNIIQGKGKLLSPAFYDVHMHIDESFTMDNDDTLSILAAIDNQEKSNLKYFDYSDDDLLEMMLKNSSRVVEMCIKNGTTLIKTNVLFTPAWKTIALEAMMILRKKYSKHCVIQTSCGFPLLFEKDLDNAAKKGEIDFVSGYPYMDETYWLTIDHIFNKAKQFDLPIDIHCGEADVPDISSFEYFLDKTEKENMQGKVSCGHLTALSAIGIDEKRANAAIERAGAINLNVVTLTSCNLYLMSSNRRGPTRVRELMDAGANISICSDNIRDTFRPYGNCNLLEEALLTAKVHKFCSRKELRQVFSMITYNSAKNALVSDYGLSTGCKADLVLLDAATPEEAILDNAAKLNVWKDGKMIARDGNIIWQ
ncbi:MAG: amidohydrolase family protein [Fastidiosipila sp.]|nr:amidohydrolase family protein [Fastidiosipila sp.]